MGMIILEPRCPKSVNGISFEPNSNWSFSELSSELESVEAKLNAPISPLDPSCFTKSPSQEFRGAGRKAKTKEAFVMRVTDIEFDESDSDDDSSPESRSVVPAGRFICNDVYISESEDSEDEAIQPLQKAFIHKMGVSEFAFLELTHEHHLSAQEEIRNQRTTVEAQVVAQNEIYTSGNAQIEKASDDRRKMDKRLDMHHQRTMAEALDKHLTTVQRDHEHRSQMEERRIRIDAAEEAKRKEKALHEENLRQLQAKAEEEAKREAAKRAEEKKAVEEVERAKEAAEKLAKENSAAAVATAQNLSSTSSTIDVPREVQSAGKLVRAAENALKLEERRLQNYKELEERNQSNISGLNMDLRRKELEIGRRIRQISGTVESVRSKASEFLKIFNDSSLPQSITVLMFAKKVIETYETPNANFNTSAFACGHVIVLVSAQVPIVMNPILAELHRVCMYTVPKHIIFSKNAFQTQESYYKSIGFREEEGSLETRDQYIERLRSYMKLYGALVQTEVEGVRNMHGLEEGWTWLAWFLKALPATEFTAVALEAFLRMAGYALHRKYKGQFRKIIGAISQEFVTKLKGLGEPRMNSVITRLQDYIESNRFLEEPEGWRLKNSLLSSNANFDRQDDGQQQYQQQYQQYHQYQSSYGRY